MKKIILFLLTFISIYSYSASVQTIGADTLRMRSGRDTLDIITKGTTEKFKTNKQRFDFNKEVFVNNMRLAKADSVTPISYITSFSGSNEDGDNPYAFDPDNMPFRTLCSVGSSLSHELWLPAYSNRKYLTIKPRFDGSATDLIIKKLPSLNTLFTITDSINLEFVPTGEKMGVWKIVSAIDLSNYYTKQQTSNLIKDSLASHPSVDTSILVHKANAETITGVKEFTNGIKTNDIQTLYNNVHFFVVHINSTTKAETGRRIQGINGNDFYYSLADSTGHETYRYISGIGGNDFYYSSANAAGSETNRHIQGINGNDFYYSYADSIGDETDRYISGINGNSLIYSVNDGSNKFYDQDNHNLLTLKNNTISIPSLTTAGIVTNTASGILGTTQDYGTLSTNQTFTGAKAFSKGAVFYGNSGTLPSGVGDYLVLYNSSTYGLRLLGFDGTNYKSFSLGARIGTTGSVFAQQFDASGNITFNGSWTKVNQLAQNIQTLTDAASVAWNGSLGANALLTLTDAVTEHTIANPTNLVAGCNYRIVIKQSANATYPGISWGTIFAFPSGIVPVLNTNANGKTTLVFFYDGTNLNLENVIAY